LSEQDLQATPGRRFERPPDEDAEAQQETIAAAPAPSRAVARLLSVWLFVLGLAACVVGVHDAGRGDEIAVRLIGTLVALAGLVVIAGGIGLLGRSPRGRSLGSVGCLVGVALGVMLTVSQLANDRFNAIVFVWIAIAVASGVGAVLLRRDLPTAWRDFPILKSVVSLGVLTSAVQFWYGSIYLPASAPPSLTLSVSLEPVRTTAAHITLHGTATIKNTSGTRVNTISSFVRVRDSAIDPDAHPSTDFATALREAAEDPGGGPAAREFSEETSVVFVHFSKLLPEGTYFEDGETVTVPFTVFVARRRFHVVTADVDVLFARASLKLDAGRARRDVNGATIVTATPIASGGWIRDLTRSDRYVRSTWSVDPNRSIGVDVAFTPYANRAGPKRFDARLQRFYGYATANGSFQLPLSADKQR
jgi:hypothetical protein